MSSTTPTDPYLSILRADILTSVERQRKAVGHGNYETAEAYRQQTERLLDEYIGASPLIPYYEGEGADPAHHRAVWVAQREAAGRPVPQMVRSSL